MSSFAGWGEIADDAFDDEDDAFDDEQSYAADEPDPLYAALGLAPGATQDQIEEAYRDQCEALASGAAPDAFIDEVNDEPLENAYAILGNPAARDDYHLAAGLRPVDRLQADEHKKTLEALQNDLRSGTPVGVVLRGEVRDKVVEFLGRFHNETAFDWFTDSVCRLCSENLAEILEEADTLVGLRRRIADVVEDQLDFEVHLALLNEYRAWGRGRNGDPAVIMAEVRAGVARHFRNKPHPYASSRRNPDGALGPLDKLEANGYFAGRLYGMVLRDPEDDEAQFAHDDLERLDPDDDSIKGEAQLAHLTNLDVVHGLKHFRNTLARQISRFHSKEMRRYLEGREVVRRLVSEELRPRLEKLGWCAWDDSVLPPPRRPKGAKHRRRKKAQWFLSPLQPPSDSLATKGHLVEFYATCTSQEFLAMRAIVTREAVRLDMKPPPVNGEPTTLYLPYGAKQLNQLAALIWKRLPLVGKADLEFVAASACVEWQARFMPEGHVSLGDMEESSETRDADDAERAGQMPADADAISPEDVAVVRSLARAAVQALDDDKKVALMLRLDGMSYKAAAAALNEVGVDVGGQAVWNWSNEFAAPGSPLREACEGLSEDQVPLFVRELQSVLMETYPVLQAAHRAFTTLDRQGDEWLCLLAGAVAERVWRFPATPSGKRQRAWFRASYRIDPLALVGPERRFAWGDPRIAELLKMKPDDFRAAWKTINDVLAPQEPSLAFVLAALRRLLELVAQEARVEAMR